MFSGSEKWYQSCMICHGSGRDTDHGEPKACVECSGTGKTPIGAYTNGGPGRNPQATDPAFPQKEY